MRDLKIVIAFILGTVLIVVPALCTLWIVAPVHVDFVYMQPILSGKILHFFASDPTSTMSSNTKIAIHVDRLAYHFRPPERFELVVFVRNQPKPQEGDQRIRTVWGTRSIFSWDDEDSVAGRVVGLPGDGIEIAGGQLHINGQIWEEPYITAENRSEDSLEFRTLGPSEYLILPENRHLLGELKQELVVNRSRISGREVINRWPLGWWFFRSTVFLKGRPAAAIPTR